MFCGTTLELCTVEGNRLLGWILYLIHCKLMSLFLALLTAGILHANASELVKIHPFNFTVFYRELCDHIERTRDTFKCSNWTASSSKVLPYASAYLSQKTSCLSDRTKLRLILLSPNAAPPLRYAWFNSTCHNPRGLNPGDLAYFSLFPTPGQERG